MQLTLELLDCGVTEVDSCVERVIANESARVCERIFEEVVGLYESDAIQKAEELLEQSLSEMCGAK